MRRQTGDQRASLRRLVVSERRRAIRSTARRSEWMVFRDRMRRIAQEGAVPEHRRGLCYEAPCLLYDEVVALQQFWPDRSGRRDFPVPAPLDLQDKVRRSYIGYWDEGRSAARAACFAYREAYREASETSRYEGAYGMYRRRLASFLWAAVEEILDGTGESA